MSQPQSTVSIPTNSSIYPVLSRYQQHVHHLEKQAGKEILFAKQDTLVTGIPVDLQQFLLTHNGAILSMGSDCSFGNGVESSHFITSKCDFIATMHSSQPIQIDGKNRGVSICN